MLVDWSLRTCGRRGHITYAPTEPALRERLHVETPVGEAWRCLRCGDFVIGDSASETGRRKTPRPSCAAARCVTRSCCGLLAVERFLRGLVIGVGSYAVLRYSHSENSLRALFEKDLPAAKPLANAFGYNLDNSSVVREIRKLLLIKPSTLHLIAILLAVYAAIELCEAVGLWLLKRWGEYFAAVATAIFLPYEIHDIIDKVTALRVGFFTVNVAAVVYLLWTKRLFGIRGGYAAYEAMRHEESLLEVEEAARPEAEVS